MRNDHAGLPAQADPETARDHGVTQEQPHASAEAIENAWTSDIAELLAANVTAVSVQSIARLLHSYSVSTQVYKDLLQAKGDRAISTLKWGSARSMKAATDWATDDACLDALLDALAFEISEINAPF